MKNSVFSVPFPQSNSNRSTEATPRLRKVFQSSARPAFSAALKRMAPLETSLERFWESQLGSNTTICDCVTEPFSCNTKPSPVKACSIFSNSFSFRTNLNLPVIARFLNSAKGRKASWSLERVSSRRNHWSCTVVVKRSRILKTARRTADTPAPFTFSTGKNHSFDRRPVFLNGLCLDTSNG